MIQPYIWVKIVQSHDSHKIVTESHKIIISTVFESKNYSLHVVRTKEHYNIIGSSLRVLNISTIFSLKRRAFVADKVKILLSFIADETSLKRRVFGSPTRSRFYSRLSLMRPRWKDVYFSHLMLNLMCRIVTFREIYWCGNLLMWNLFWNLLVTWQRLIEWTGT